ncbi:ABC transporter ATP-binding protein [Bacillus sp. MRMR6]|uniref:ABC transporter ATP-binding protein n=1 Tax=Bacillus sp. MRMR6 TaxID=1928617 RepID=UPI000953675B|nr:ABC transporter ATP-binding protein [Bacillus sp. MRMR6]OLS37865.1 dipeptide/oligopeptide/nickel ABC transporter ATP-binding protein [Bacillus sp. MRMR6]
MAVLTISNLTIKHKKSSIVKNLNLSINEGDWLALVGESGSGKSITASSIGGLLPRELISSGSIRLGEVELSNMKGKEWRNYRGRVISYVFQDYQGAFTPFMTIGAQFDEMLKTHSKDAKKQRKAKALESLKIVNLPEERVYKSYPFQLSGGQLQRAAIAMAMILKPKLLIADEPTTALDSITAANVLQLIAELKRETNCAVLFITHDLRHARKYANKMAVMLEGEIVESGSKNTILQQPRHIYTKSLVAAIPSLRTSPERLLSIQ